MQNERKEAEDQQRKILEETERRLELQRKHLENLKLEQDTAKANAQQGIIFIFHTPLIFTQSAVRREII